MAVTKSRKTDSKKTARGVPKVEWKGYVNWPMSVVDKKLFDNWSDRENPFENIIPTLLDSGYKVSLSYDQHNQACVASLYCKEPSDPNGGWCLTARAAYPFDALQRVLFIHTVCFEGVWPDEFDNDSDGWQ